MVKYACIFNRNPIKLICFIPIIMEKDPNFEPYQEEEKEKLLPPKIENSLPYLQEEKIELPKDYIATLERLKSQLQQSEDSSSEGKALFFTGLVIAIILFFAYINNVLGLPKWLDWLHHLFIFAEASIPFALSFFLKKNKHATILRFIGIIVVLVYLFTLFF